MKTTAQILRDYRGPALFSFGFRPFFLVASIWSALSVPLWLLAYLGNAEASAAIFTRDWHVHEMLFGYTAAVIVGYMTIAGANWTGHYPVAGRPIVVLLAVWIAGRAAMLAYPILGLTAAVIDATFLILFSLALWRELLAATNSRVVAPTIVITLLAIANIAFHARTILPAVGPVSERMTIGLITFLIALMGGRLVPSFTRNWMAQRKITPQPAPYGRFDVTVLAATAAGIASWIAVPDSRISGALLTTAGLGLLIRLLRWRGWIAARDGMVLILHLAYFWCALGVALLGASVLFPAEIPTTAAIHALTAGAIGVMTLAVMTRTTLSHTGRGRNADRATLLIYLLANLAALTRTLAPFIVSLYAELLLLSAICWSLAFGLFALSYGPMLTKAWHGRSRDTSA
jgi:uncharacterized protein involved in response to NO